MRITMLGSHLCPDCVDALMLLGQHGIKVDYFDITENISYLKGFLKLRDHSGLFEPIIAQGKIGIPCMILPGGAMLFDPADVLAAFGQ